MCNFLRSFSTLEPCFDFRSDACRARGKTAVSIVRHSGLIICKSRLIFLRRVFWRCRKILFRGSRGLLKEENAEGANAPSASLDEFRFRSPVANRIAYGGRCACRGCFRRIRIPDTSMRCRSIQIRRRSEPSLSGCKPPRQTSISLFHPGPMSWPKMRQS